MSHRTLQRLRRQHARGSLPIILTLLLLLPGAATAQAAKAGPPQAVIVAPVAAGTVADRVEALGTASANESVLITANVTEKVQSVHFDDGQQVATGDVLVVLEQAEEQANLAQAQAQLAERELALKRLLKLEQSRLTAPDLIDSTRSEVAQARASIKAIQARIDDRTVRAPFAGKVGLRHISVGALVEVADPIVTLDDTQVIKLDFTVPAVFLAELHTGMPIEARARALGEQVHQGEVASIDSRVDPVTRSVRVRALLPNPDGQIVPGVLMRVDLLRNRREALVIPEAALLPEGDRQFVLVRVQRDGGDAVARRPVEIGARLAGRVEVTSGLAAGEQVVTHGAIKAKPGSAVRVLAVDDGSTDLSEIIKGKTLGEP